MSTKFPKTVLIALLISSLPRTTIPAAQAGIVGQVVDSRGASLGGIPVPGASTILAGDILATDHSGRALVSLPSGDRLNLTGDTSIRFDRDRSGIVARISSGDLVAEERKPGALAIEASQYRITVNGARPAACFVAMLPDRRTLVSARQGGISVTDLHSGVARELAAGQQIALAAPAVPGQEPEPSQSAPPRPAGQAPAPGTPAPPTTTPESAPPRAPPTQGGGAPTAAGAAPAAHGSNTTLILLLVGGAVAGGIGAAAAAGGGHGGGGGGGGPVSPSAP